MADQRPNYAPPQAPAEPEALRNLIVNYIPTTVDETQLRQLFETYGPIESVKIVFNRETRQSRGFGFVKYQYAVSAMQAINFLNGYPLMNKRLKVAFAKENEAQIASQQMNMYAPMMMMPGYGGMMPQQQPPNRPPNNRPRNNQNPNPAQGGAPQVGAPQIPPQGAPQGQMPPQQ